MFPLLKLAISLSTISTAVAAATQPRYKDPPPSHLSTPNADGKHWPGWAGIQKYFPFGDSYSSTLFYLNGIQPGPNNPFGNPQPYGPGNTSSNGLNYVDFLTTVYNESHIETYNLAFGGATVSSAVVAQNFPTVVDFRGQVNDEFLPYYVKLNLANNLASNWTSSNSLFSTFFGINDVGNAYHQYNTTLNPAIFKAYASLIDQLYVAGARNFLFINVPPVDRSPGTIGQGPATQHAEGAAIAAFNLGIQRLATNLSIAYNDTTAFQFDANALFTQVLDDPSAYPQTAHYKNTTAYCAAYQDGTPKPDSFNETCGIPVNEYFWLNDLHPTYPMHDAMAKAIVDELTVGGE